MTNHSVHMKTIYIFYKIKYIYIYIYTKLFSPLCFSLFHVYWRLFVCRVVSSTDSKKRFNEQWARRRLQQRWQGIVEFFILDRCCFLFLAPHQYGAHVPQQCQGKELFQQKYHDTNQQCGRHDAVLSTNKRPLFWL